MSRTPAAIGTQPTAPSVRIARINGRPGRPPDAVGSDATERDHTNFGYDLAIDLQLGRQRPVHTHVWVHGSVDRNLANRRSMVPNVRLS